MPSTLSEWSGAQPSKNMSVPEFDGTDASKFEQWKIWVDSYLRKKRNNGMKEEHLGYELITLLKPDTPVFKLVTRMKNYSTIITQVDGYKKILAYMEKRYSIQSTEEEQTEALSAVKTLKPERGEMMKAYLGRADTVFDEGENHGVSYSDQVKTDMIMDNLGMPMNSQSRAIVISTAQGSQKYSDIKLALLKLYPITVPDIHARDAFHADARSSGDAGGSDSDGDPGGSPPKGGSEPKEGSVRDHCCGCHGRRIPRGLHVRHELHQCGGDLDGRREPGLRENLRRVGAEQGVRHVATTRARHTSRQEADEAVSGEKTPRAKLIRRKGRCWRCGGTGHLKRDCDQPAMPKGQVRRQQSAPAKTAHPASRQANGGKSFQAKSSRSFRPRDR